MSSIIRDTGFQQRRMRHNIPCGLRAKQRSAPSLQQFSCGAGSGAVETSSQLAASPFDRAHPYRFDTSSFSSGFPLRDFLFGSRIDRTVIVLESSLHDICFLLLPRTTRCFVTAQVCPFRRICTFLPDEFAASSLSILVYAQSLASFSEDEPMIMVTSP